MKTITAIILVNLLLILSPITWAGNNYHIGEISPDNVLSQFPKFTKHHNDVTYSDQQINHLKTYPKAIEIEVYFGQWCHDSQREVPRLIKLIQQVDNPNISLYLYGLDIRKSDPKGQAKANQIKRTPTVIVKKDGEELGRFLEFPQTNWATDISSLLQ